MAFNQYYDSDRAIVFREACRLGCEGIVSKRLGSLYRLGVRRLAEGQEPNAPAVKREADEAWGSCRSMGW